MNPSVPTISPTDRVIRSVDVPASAVGTVANGIEDFYTGELDVIVVRQALDVATMRAAGELLDRDEGVGWERPNQASPVEDIGMLGTPATPTYKAPAGPALEAYLKDAAWHRAAAGRASGHHGRGDGTRRRNGDVCRARSGGRREWRPHARL